MNKEAASKYSVEMAVDQGQIDRVSSIFYKNGNAKNDAHIVWQYASPPGGGAYTAFAVDQDGQDAAVYSVFKVKAKVYGDTVNVCQSLDTLTDKSHRGKGLFPIVASKVFRKCDDDGVAFIYGFPNSSSAPGFFNRLGWRKMGVPPFLFYMNNILFPLAYFFRKKFFLKNYMFLLYLFVRRSFLGRLNGFQVERSVEFCTNDYDMLWNKFSENIAVTVLRDSEYMEWRYKEKPRNKYSYVSVKKDGELAGVVVFCMADKHNGRIGYIMDVIYDPTNPDIASFLVAEAVISMSALGVDVVLAWSAPKHPGNGAYKKSIFLRMPRILQPIKLYFGCRLNPNVSSTEIAVSDFYVSYADSDTV